MFQIKKVTPASSFKWPVPVNVPQDGGGFRTFSFTAEFKMMEQDAIDAMMERFRNDDTDMLPEILVGWTGVQDEDKNDFPYSEENKAVLVNIPYVRTALVSAFFEAVSGNKKKVKLGN